MLFVCLLGWFGLVWFGVEIGTRSMGRGSEQEQLSMVLVSQLRSFCWPDAPRGAPSLCCARRVVRLVLFGLAFCWGRALIFIIMLQEKSAVVDNADHKHGMQFYFTEFKGKSWTLCELSLSSDKCLYRFSKTCSVQAFVFVKCLFFFLFSAL